MNKPLSCHEVLRTATGELHTHLEQTGALAQMLEATDPVTHYRALLPGLWHFYAATEPVLEPFLQDPSGPGLPALSPSRLALLQQDRDAHALPTADMPAIPLPANSPLVALGWCYVVEGATLGGKLIARILAKKGVALEECRFFLQPPAGAARRFQSLMRYMDAQSFRADQMADICAAAEAAFRCFFETVRPGTTADLIPPVRATEPL